MQPNLSSDDVRRLTSECARRAEKTDDLRELRQLSQQLVPLLTEYWNVHPHSAMEMLESATFAFPVSLAHALVRDVVTNWKKNPTYSPEAGGSADHCYMSALILSENLDLADEGWSDRLLPRTLNKELGYPRFDRMKDAAQREAIVRAIAKSTGFVPPPR